MKALVSIFILFFCLPILPQDFIKQISQIDNDARNLKFILANPHEVWQTDWQYVFESHTDSSINIFIGYYSPEGDSFFNQHPLTNNNFQNTNACGRRISYSSNSVIVLYQSNRNGNWDIFARVLQGSVWSLEKPLFNSSNDETSPVIIRDYQFFFADDSVRFLYNSGSSVFLATYKDSIIRNTEIYTGNDSVSYSSFDAAPFYLGLNDPRSGLYITAQKNRTGLNPQIVYRLLKENGTLEPEVLIAESPTLANPGFSIFNFTSNFHYEEIVNNKKNILVSNNWPYSTSSFTLLKENPEGDLSDFCSSPVVIVTRDHYAGKPMDLFIYETHSYKQTLHDSTFIRLNYYDWDWSPDTLLFTSVHNTSIQAGEMGFDGFHLVFYTAWEDSIGDKIGILGRKQLFLLGSVRGNRNNVSFQLHQNYPNPFNPATNIRYNLTERGFVVIKVFDVLGNELKTLVNTEQDAGEYLVNFNASELPSGVYFYRMQINNSFQTRKMVLIR